MATTKRRTSLKERIDHQRRSPHTVLTVNDRQLWFEPVTGECNHSVDLDIYPP